MNNDWETLIETLGNTTTARRVTVSERTLRGAIEAALMSYTRAELEIILRDELQLPWTHEGSSPDDRALTKRNLVGAYTREWAVPQLVGLGRRIVNELAESTGGELRALIDEYNRGGGVGSSAKNLIFAANGPKPEIVLRDAVSNDIEIVRNGEYCLVYEEAIPADGLTFQRLVDWWRRREDLGDPTVISDQEVGRSLYARLAASLGGNHAERRILDVYARRYRDNGFGIPALIPQVYLHYDPYTHRSHAARGVEGSPLPRQRMDFLLLFSDRVRVVIEVDGKQHYSDGRGSASPILYAQMVAEDRRLRLSGYEVYRFGGYELTTVGADELVSDFFDQLQRRMSG